MSEKKRKVTRVLKTVAAADAVFTYISVCCSAAAEKPACTTAKGQRVGDYIGAKPEGEASLGSWRCTACRKPASVTRHNKVQPQEPVNV